MGRMIGIRHRRKRTAEGEARPTQVAIAVDGKMAIHDLPDDQAELDFVFGRFPVKFREVNTETDVLANFASHHVKWREVKKDEEVPAVPEAFLKKIGKKVFVAVKVPSEYEGLVAGDTVAMTLGGSGDMLAYAAVRRAEEIGASVLRIPPFQLKAVRGEHDKEDDSVLLARLASEKPDLFYKIQSRDKDVILMREMFRQRIDAMKARIAVEQRLYQVFVGKIFASHSPEAEIEKRFEEEKVNDPILKNMVSLEQEANRQLAKAIEALDIYKEIFAPIEGVGPQTSARIIAGIIDIRRFASRDKFVAFCGTSCSAAGKFRRKRRAEICNWSPSVRQGLWLIISDQANKRPDSVWGVKLREAKAKFREKHPVPVEVEIGENGKRKNVKRYTDGHIHKMAVWKTMTGLARHIYRAWTALEQNAI